MGGTLRLLAPACEWRAEGPQEHFIDLCRLLGEPTPVEADATGETHCLRAGRAQGHGPGSSV